MISVKLADFLALIRKKRLLFANFLLGAVAVALGVNALQPPVYQASVEILAERSQAAAVMGGDAYKSVGLDETFFQTQFRLLRSVAVVGRAVDRLYPAADADERERRMREIKAAIVTRPVVGTTIFVVDILGRDPGWASTIANTIADVYIEQNIEAQINASKEIFVYLSKRVGEVRGGLEGRQRALASVGQRAGIYGGTSVQAGQVSEFQSRYLDARAERVDAENRMKEFQRLYGDGRYGDLKDVVDDAVVRDLSEKIRTAELNLAAMKRQYREKHPEVRAAENEIAGLRQKLQDEGRRAVDRYRVRIDTMRSREDALGQALGELKSEASRQSTDVSRYAVLQQEIASNESLYDTLLKKFQEMSVGGGSGVSIRVLTPAATPGRPIKPKKAYNILFGLIFGLFIAMGAVFLDEYLDTTVKTAQDVERLLNVPVIGRIPYSPGPAAAEPGTEVPIKEGFGFVEGFRVLRTNVQFSAVEQPIRKLLVTSSVEGEGKSTVSANLAMSCAKLGKKTILMECDLRKPTVHRQFPVRGGGLAGLLIGEGTIDTSVVESPVPNLWVLPAGAMPPNPPELLNSKRMEDVLAALEERFEMVIMDSPPCIPVSDTAILAAKSDAVVIVVSAGRVHREFCLDAMKQLEKAKARVIGAVLNNRTEESTYYYPYYHRYYDSYRTGGDDRSSLPHPSGD